MVRTFAISCWLTLNALTGILWTYTRQARLRCDHLKVMYIIEKPSEAGGHHVTNYHTQENCSPPKHLFSPLQQSLIKHGTPQYPRWYIYRDPEDNQQKVNQGRRSGGWRSREARRVARAWSYLQLRFILETTETHLPSRCKCSARCRNGDGGHQ